MQPDAHRTPPAAPRIEVLQGICGSELGQGDFARVLVFLDEDRRIRVLQLQPDITRFTHAPHTYFGPDGTPVLVVAERPLTPGAPERDPALIKRSELLRGLVEGGSVLCTDAR